MNCYAIVHLEANQAAAADNILQSFNEYMNARTHAMSFVTERDGYFRVECNEKVAASSAAIEAFGSFLVSTGYSISGISEAKSAEWNIGTEVRFSRKTGGEERVVLSTLNVY
ncbi:MAG: hypothetical protein NTX79_00790 [Candidatus Micrarchaeota archaeon]|nr:hypothetical protein [Candidatus Micrarchaeota archaeon]